jgi:membrane protease YdiL (CAAX protease family)
MTLYQDPNQHEFLQAVAGQALETKPFSLPERWRFRDLLIFVLVIPVLLVVSNVVAFVGYAVFKPLAGWTTPIYALQANAIFLLTLQLVFYLFLLAYIYFLIVVRYRAPFWNALKWNRLSAHNVLRFFLGGAALSLVIMIAPSFLPEKKGFPLEKMFNSPSSAYAVAAFAVVIAPFMEELLFRGLLFAFFERHAGVKFAVIATAVLFAGLHIPEYWGAWNHVLMILVVGVTFSLVRGLSGSVTPSFILHLAYNSTLMLMLFLQTQHFHKIPGFLLF